MSKPKQSAQQRHQAAVTWLHTGLQPDPTPPSSPNHPQRQAEQEVMKRHWAGRGVRRLLAYLGAKM